MDRRINLSNRLACTMVLLLIWLPASFAQTHSSATTFRDDVSTGYQLLIQKRFANAEYPLRRAISGIANQQLDTQTSLQLMSFLEMSLMGQNKYADFEALLTKKLDYLEAHDMKASSEYAITLMNHAEALYNLNKQAEAIALTKTSYAMLENLPSAPPGAIDHASANLAQFEAGLPSKQVLPQDMSNFFTKCESIKMGMAMAHVRKQFSSELEVGQDYEPTGMMKEIFATALPVGTNKLSVEGLQRTIFIPDINHKSDWCIVFAKNGDVEKTLISAD